MKNLASIFTLTVATTFALGVTACGPGKSTDDGDSDSETTGDEETGTGTETGDGTGEETGGFLESTGESTDTMMDPLPNGETCAADDECESGKCFETAVGSVCSECKSDQECMDEGNGINCTFNGSFFECSDGAAGEMCDTEAGCMDGLFCSQVVNTGGLIPDKFCSECDTTADCEDPQVCNPEFVPDIMMPMGQNVCVDQGSVALDAFCDHEGDGDLACESGICSVADIMGFLMLGVCGECKSDDDCDGGTCTPAELDVNTFMVTGSRCN